MCVRAWDMVIGVVVRGKSVPKLVIWEYGGDYNSLRPLEVEEDRARTSERP